MMGKLIKGKHGKGKVNEAWHRENPMPKNPTMAERADWHTRHTEHCGCREMPESIMQYLKLKNSQK
jgi:hypothetical protein